MHYVKLRSSQVCPSGAEATMTDERVRVFWQPGCSSCVKVKEFLASRGVDFESINVLQDDTAPAQLAVLGAQSIPVVARGNTFVFAQSLPQVARFLGLPPTSTQMTLPAETLMARWVYFLERAMAMTVAIPPERLDHRPVAERDRSVRALAYHIFQVPEAFLATVVAGLEDWTLIATEPVPTSIRSVDDILGYARRMTGNLEDWWQGLADKTCRWPVHTFYGEQPAIELLERQTWHSAQHARQLETVLQSFGVTPEVLIAPAAYDGLPMPAGLWD
jgi:glutaredoxin